MKQNLILLKSRIIVAKKHAENWMFGILLGIVGAMKNQVGILRCGEKKSSSSTTLWTNNAEDGLITICCTFVKQWWWVFTIISAICWAIFTWIGNEKVAAKFKTGTFAIILLFVASLLEPQIKASIEAIANAIAG